ncbi:MAG: FadR/GntR family transcriptional regulator [Clostridia bacterium]
MFETVESKKIFEIIIEQIQQMIMNGSLKNGDKLPPERELTEMFNVGRPALREALKALEVIGLIECRHGQGNYIINNIENNFFKPLSLSFRLSNGNIEEILQLRYIVESFTAEQAALVATEDDIKKLYDIMNNMMDAKTENEKSYFDKLFHYEIASICKNKLIINLLGSLSYLLDSFIEKTVRMSFFGEDSIEKIYNEHTRIIKAIEAHNSEEAIAATNYHLNQINTTMLKDI